MSRPPSTWLRHLARELTPPVVRRLVRPVRPPEYGFFGDLERWSDARQQSTGYDDPGILERVEAGASQVRTGGAVYERDSVVFDHVEYAWFLLASLIWIASRNDNRLNVLDFGGSLGTSYRQNRGLLTHLQSLRWNIVEQEAFVKRGKCSFEDAQLRFFFSIDECLATTTPDVIVASGVLQYLEDPFRGFADLLRTQTPYVIVDGTLFFQEGRDRLTIQRVPPHIYPASYPCWIFDRDKFTRFGVSFGYEVVAQFEAPGDVRLEPDGAVTRYGGILLARAESSR